MVRADSGFCRDELFVWPEEHDVDYVIGVARNKRLEALVAAQLEEAQHLYEESGGASRVFTEFRYQTLNSWSKERRVVAKAEYLGSPTRASW